MSTVADIMSHEVITIGRDTPVRDIARLLCTKRISGVPVTEADGTLVGVVSESDLMVHAAAIGEQGGPNPGWWKSLFVNKARLARHYARTHGTTAEDVMTAPVLTIGEDAPVAEITRIMGQHGVKRLPVMRDGHLVGIVTRADLLKIIAGSAPSRAGEPSDEQILQSLLATLQAQAWTRLSAKNIQVEDGVVRLIGSVKTEEERHALHVAASTTPGVVGIEDHLAPVIVPPVV